MIEDELKRISRELNNYLIENNDIREDTWFQYMKIAKKFIDKSLESLK